jgi:DNA-binding CsgD family transcriptional regulator
MAEGVRHMTLFYYYASCRGEYACLHPGSGMAHAWAVARTVELNATFSPPLDAAEVMSAVTQSAAGPLRRWQADTIARALQVAPSEAEALDLSAIAPASVRKRRKEQNQVVAKSRQEAQLQRADAIRALIAKHPKWSDMDIGRELGVDRKTVANHRAQMERTMPDISTAHQRELPGL